MSLSEGQGQTLMRNKMVCAVENEANVSLMIIGVNMREFFVNFNAMQRFVGRRNASASIFMA